MSEAATAAAHSAQASQEIRDAIVSRPQASAFAYNIPELNLTHAAMSIRTGGRILRWAWGLAFFRPGVLATICWFGWGWLSHLADAAAVATPIVTVVTWRSSPNSPGIPLRDSTGHVLQNVADVSRLASPVAMAATWCWVIAVFCTIGAFTMIMLNLSSQPTHRLGPDGRWQATNGYTTVARRRQGVYGRVRAVHGGVKDDWHAAQHDVSQMNRRLERLGHYRLRRWGRQWSAERAAGVPDKGLTRAGPVDRWLFTRTKPPRKAVSGRKAKAQKQRKPRAVERAEQIADESEWAILEGQTLGAVVAHTDRSRELVHGTPRAGLDRGAPTVPERSTAAEDPQIRTWRQRAIAVGDGAERGYL